LHLFRARGGKNTRFSPSTGKGKPLNIYIYIYYLGVSMD
jgi:hypothetical protein